MKTEYKKYKPKKILNTYKHIDGAWFWIKYSAHPYLGCQFACEYCCQWGTKYTPYKEKQELFPYLIKVKENAPELLKKELKNAEKELIAVGDWQAAESKFGISRKMLEVCLELGFPVFILEKSPQVANDLDLLKKIDKKAAAVVTFSIIGIREDERKKVFEPLTPTYKSRFAAMKKIAKAGIMTGTVLMPVLSKITDDVKTLEEVIKKTKESGGQFVLAAGLTLEPKTELRRRYFELIGKHYPEHLEWYQTYLKGYSTHPSYWPKIQEKVDKYCDKHDLLNHIPRPVKFYPKDLFFNKEVSAKFHQKAKDLEFRGKNKYQVWAYRKAAWAIDDLDESLEDIYKHTWLTGIQRIPGIGNRLAHEIEREIKEKAPPKIRKKQSVRQNE